MENAHISGESSATLQNLKTVRAEETSTRYKPPTCEDSPSSPERKLAQSPKEQKPELNVEKSRDPGAESSFSKRSTVTWSGVPLTRYPPPESIARFSQATTATPYSGYKKESAPLQAQSPHAARPGTRPIVAPMNLSMTPNDSSNRDRRSRTDIRVDEYTDSEEESQNRSEDSWELILEETAPEGSAFRPPIMPRRRRGAIPRPPMGSAANRNRSSQGPREAQRQQSTDRESVNIVRSKDAGARPRSNRAQSTENHRPFPESSHIPLPPRISAQPWGLSQPESYRTPLRAFEHAYQEHPSAPNPFANPYLPYNQGVFPHPTPYHAMDHTFSVPHNPYYNFQSHSAQPNRHPREQSLGLIQATQAPPRTKSPVISPSEPSSSEQVDPIELVEDYLESLRISKETELLEATRILSWINQRSAKRVEQEASSVRDFEVVDNESNANGRSAHTVVSFARTPGRAQSTYEAPLQVLHRPRQPDAETVTQRILDESGDVSTRSLYSDHTIRPYVPTRYTPSIEPPKTVKHDLTCSDTDSLKNNQSISSTSEDHDDDGMLEEINSLRQDNASLRQQLDRKDEAWYGFNVLNTYAQWKRSFRNRPALGKRRFYWTCECGEEMFADLPLTNYSDCQQMLEFLSRPSDPRDQDQTTPSQLERGVAQSNHVTQNPSQNSLGKGKTSASTISSGTTQVDTSGSQSAQAQSNGFYSSAKYLELCVNVDKYKTKLAEVQITAANRSGLTICTDGHLFQKIYTRYFELRKNSWRKFLYRPAGIKFVHFAVQQSEEVIFYSEDQYPTEDVLLRKLYEYDLRPPIPPPMDSRTFLHYFYEHKAHSQLRSAKFVHRLPKKLGESLIRSIALEEFREGWGIHIMEGPNKVAICWALMIALLASFGVSLCYDLITKTGDSGFAIGQWMVAALTVALSALYFSLEDEVNSNFD